MERNTSASFPFSGGIINPINDVINAGPRIECAPR